MLRGPANDVPVALASQHSHGSALRDVLAFRDDVNSFRSDLCEPCRPKIRHGDAVQADEVGSGKRRDVAFRLRGAMPEKEPGEAGARRQVTEPGDMRPQR